MADEVQKEQTVEPATEEKTKEPAKNMEEPKSVVAGMKQAVKRLREQKKEAIPTKDKKKINVLRRRISRLRKRTKKVVKAKKVTKA